MELEKQGFGTLPDGREIDRYTLRNNHGMEVDVINYGAIITAIRVPDKHNNPGDVVLGFDTLEGYLGDQPYLGAMIGRVCNRIGNARFEIDGKIYNLSHNEGNNQLHGGVTGFDKKPWFPAPGRKEDEVFLALGLESADGEEGYPGNVQVEVVYSLNDRNELGITCRAKTDKPTHLNLTNHSYFNLNNCRGTVLDHELFIDADRVTELDAESIPTGRILPVEGTPYDFRESHAIGKRIREVEPGYDINYVLARDQRELVRVASVYDPASGRIMEVLTTLPGVQLYTSNHIEDLKGKGGLHYGKHSALCLETQYFPDSPNQSSFPSTILRPGASFESTTIYRFSTQHE
ncbi:MAG: aldose epimerase family protein [Bacteroidales bacterium]